MGITIEVETIDPEGFKLHWRIVDEAWSERICTNEIELFGRIFYLLRNYAGQLEENYE